MDVNPLIQVAPFVQTKIEEIAAAAGVPITKKWSPKKCQANGADAQPYVQRLNLRMVGLATLPAWALVAQPRQNPALTGIADVITSTAKNILMLDSDLASFTFSRDIPYKGMPVPIDEYGPFDVWLLTTAAPVAMRWFLQFQYSPIAGND